MNVAYKLFYLQETEMLLPLPFLKKKKKHAKLRSLNKNRFLFPEVAALISSVMETIGTKLALCSPCLLQDCSLLAA